MAYFEFISLLISTPETVGEKKINIWILDSSSKSFISYICRSPSIWLRNSAENSEEKNYRVEFILKWKDYMNPMKIFQAASIISKNLVEIQQNHSAPNILETIQEKKPNNPKEDLNENLTKNKKKNVQKSHWLRFNK